MFWMPLWIAWMLKMSDSTVLGTAFWNMCLIIHCAPGSGIAIDHPGRTNFLGKRVARPSLAFGFAAALFP
jgi:hypothetical protein